MSPSVSVSVSPSVSASVSPSVSPSASVSSSVSPSPSLGYQNYTRGDVANLPTNDTDLETVYTAQEETDVTIKNEVMITQTGTVQYMVHQFKEFVGANTQCRLECEAQTTLSPVASTVYLQVYNHVSLAWENIDSDSDSEINTDFTLQADIEDLTDYKDTSNIISCRVYQLAL
jgi:hypothetical protein